MDEDCHLGEFESSLLCLALCIYKVFLGSRALHAHPNQGQDVELPFLLELQHLLPFQWDPRAMGPQEGQEQAVCQAVCPDGFARS